ncbi:hypothetical protein Zm00014a_029897, partial [Zea mays]
VLNTLLPSRTIKPQLNTIFG